MFIYAGIDEAGYGPMFGPLVVGCVCLAVPKLDHDAPPPQLWQRLSKAVARDLRSAKGRLVVNDSKKVKTKAAGLRHLELGCLAFAALAGHRPEAVDGWLGVLGETCHRPGALDGMPWYHDHDGWDALPTSVTDGELAVARGMLAATCQRIGVEVVGVHGAVVLEDRFNDMVTRTRSKAATSFTFVARHIRRVWDRHAADRPTVVIDRQGGRTRYRELLSQTVPEAAVRVLEETPACASYQLEGPDGCGMALRFMVEAESAHMPVALASMVSKYTRELMMARFNAYFTRHVPAVAPTAGYGSDAKRFWNEIRPQLQRLGIAPDRLKRMA